MKKKQFKPKNDMFIYMLAVLIFIVPLIVFLKVDTLPKDLAEIIGTESYPDLFAYYKAYVLQIGAFIMFILAIGYRFYYEKSFKPDVFIWLLMAFAASILLSYVFSEHKEVALRGAFERYEGTLTWLSYVALSYSVYTLVEKKRDAYILIGAFVLSSALVSLIGAFQYFGMDFFKTDLGKRMMLGGYYEQLASNLDFKMEKGRVYSTLYNPNYVGSMIALAFPLTVYLMDELRKRWVFILGSFIIVLQMISLVGSRSAGGFFGVAFAVLLMGFYFAWRHPKRMVMIPVVCALLLIGAVGAYQVPYVKANVSKAIYGITENKVVDFPVKDINVEANSLKFVLQDGSWFTLTPVDGQIEVKTTEIGKIEKENIDQKTRFFINFENYRVYVYHIPYQNEVIVYSENKEQGILYPININLLNPNAFSFKYFPISQDNINAEYKAIFKNEKAFSNRGYIWNRTLPLIMKNPLFGYGGDNFVMIFPKIDLLSRMKYLSPYDILVDKPHSLYLQFLVNFGIVGALMFLSLVLLFFKNARNFILYVTVLSFLIIGFVNDSVLYVTMFIFVLIGLVNKIKEVREAKIK